MRYLKPTLTLTLCLILLATSVTSAVAHGQMAFGQLMQLCSGGEAVTVVVDARGNPVDATHPCPECVAVVAALPPSPVVVFRPAGRWARSAPALRVSVASQAVRAHMARGPPVVF